MADPDYLGNAYLTRSVDESINMMTRKAAYRKFPHVSTLMTKAEQAAIAGEMSWMQKMGLAPKMGLVGLGTGPASKAFLSPYFLRLSAQEAKFHMMNSLFESKGSTNKKFRQLYKSMSGDIAKFGTDILFYDNIIHNTDAWKEHVMRAAEYTSKHAGGIVGDHIKEQYFSAGKQSWAPLSLGTVANKEKYQKVYNTRPDIKMPYINVPMWGITGKQSQLPDNWRRYTYKFANWPQGSGAIRTVPYIKDLGSSMGMQRTSGFVVTRGFRKGGRGRTMMGGKFLSKKDYGRGERGVTYPNPNSETGLATMYAPTDRVSLMDIVAYLNPIAHYKNSPRNGGRGYIYIENIIEPFSQMPSVFLHEKGYTTNKGAKVPARPFLGPGLKNGVNDATRLFHQYIRTGNRGIRTGIHLTGQRLYSAANTDIIYGAHYMHLVHQKYGGLKGVNKDGYTVFSSVMDVGQINRKIEATKKNAIIQFNSRHLWWFLPPSKYYHYVGMGFDIASVVMGGFWSMGAITAWIQAMSVGMAGARMGTPVPFTRKAQRRKFRKGLYTRAGYHRSGSLGTGGR